MTLQSDATPMPAYDPGIFAGWFGEKDRTQWQWEAPTSRLSNNEATAPALPSWLLEWGATPKKNTSQPSTAKHARDRRKNLSFRSDEVAALRLELEACSGDTSVVCNKFNQRIKQSLTLGLVSEETLKHVLKAVPGMIMSLGVDTANAESQSLDLYQAVWDGLEACKVFGTEMLHGKTLDRLISLVGQLSMTAESRELGTRIVRNATSIQLKHMKNGIDRIVIAWLLSTAKAMPLTLVQASHQEAKASVSEPKHRLNRIRQLSGRFDDARALEYLGQIHSEVQAAGAATQNVFGKVQKAEYAIEPTKDASASLVEFIGYLPGVMVGSIIRSSAHYIANGSFGIKDNNRTTKLRLEMYFLSVVAQLPGVRDDLFETLLKGTACPLQTPYLSHLVLQQWISQGRLKEAAAVRNTFEATAPSAGVKDFARLLLAVDKHDKTCWVHLRSLVKLLNGLSKQQLLHQTVIGMHRASMRVPADLMGHIIDSVSTFDPRMAHDLFNLYFAMRANFAPIRLELYPNFIRSMIKDPVITPETIWKVMGIPIYQSRGRTGFSSKPLSPKMAQLINNMAVWFACSKRPPRVAFRMVQQCLWHLRKHGAPVSSELTRAIAKSGITSKILEGKWVPPERMDWALRLIEEAEGTEVAMRADAAVEHWNEAIAERRNKARREMNVLSVGPID